MIELPEAVVLSQQIRATLTGKRIASVVPKQSPHKLAGYFGDPEAYDDAMRGATIETATPVGGFVEIHAGAMRLLFSEGIRLSFIESEARLPKKHQLLVGFDDGTYLAAAVQMYGGMGFFRAGELDNPYYLGARAKPAPTTDGFTEAYFTELVGDPALQKKSAKAVLATEQRIPGLGNGVLQDILYDAHVHPKRKWATLDDDGCGRLYESIQATLAAMADAGGRDTEKDLFGDPGGYQSRCSKHTVGTACPRCGGTIEKKAYMGGSVYFCAGCQV